MDTTPQTLAKKTRAELLTMLSGLDGEISAMKGRITHAQAQRRVTGEYSDPAWWSRINSALLARTQQAAQVRIALSLQREQRRQESENPERKEAFLRAFMAMAKIHLGETLYMAICEAANRSAGGEA